MQDRGWWGSWSWLVRLSFSQAAADSMVWWHCPELEGSVFQLGILSWAPRTPLQSHKCACSCCTGIFFDLAASLYRFFTKTCPVGSCQIKFFPSPLPGSSCIPGHQGSSRWSGEVTAGSDGNLWASHDFRPQIPNRWASRAVPRDCLCCWHWWLLGWPPAFEHGVERHLCLSKPRQHMTDCT